VVGGHVFGHIYSGAIGLVNTPFHHGLEAGAGPQSLCVSCNACSTVCPVGIPLPEQILKVRSMVVEEEGTPPAMRAAMEFWSRPRLVDIALRAGAIAATPLRDQGFTRTERAGLNMLPIVRDLTGWRTPPALPATPARDRLKKRRPYTARTLESGARGLRVAYFVQCITDRLFPRMALSIARVLEACGVTVMVPEKQHCCGLPALDAGILEPARRMARHTIAEFEKVETDYIITGGASCAIAMLHDYERLFEDEPLWQIRAATLASRVTDFISFMDTVADLSPGALARPGSPYAPITYHNFCQSANVLGIEDAPRRLIREVMGLELREMEESSVCCGFGGSTSITRPEVAQQILARKLENVANTGARTLVTDNPGCIMHLRGGLDARKSRVRVLHIGELMAAHLR
jgi:Fe-S oxidoreductase